jgi:hypothetical protein
MTIPGRIQTEAGRRQYAEARQFSEPVPLSQDVAAAGGSNSEVQGVREAILKARDSHAALLDDSPRLDKFVRDRMEETGERSYSATLAEVLAIAREVRSLAAQFEDPEIEDAEVARVALSHVEAARRGGNVTFAQVLREAEHD